jgi:hypothetical protein
MIVALSMFPPSALSLPDSAIRLSANAVDSLPRLCYHPFLPFQGHSEVLTEPHEGC